MHYFGQLCEVLILGCIRKLSGGCFACCRTVSSVIFESGSKLSCIESWAFYNCSSLSSIHIPSSVEKICNHCFYECSSLSTIRFESDSKLSCIERYAFYNCSSLSSIHIPSSVAKICNYCFYGIHSSHRDDLSDSLSSKPSSQNQRHLIEHFHLITNQSVAESQLSCMGEVNGACLERSCGQ
jgi:hypothetical protein